MSEVRVRSYTERDLAAVVRLISAVARHDGTGMTTRIAEQLELANLPGRDLARDRFLAFWDDRLVGYSDVWRSPSTPAADVTVAVHGAWRGRGIGTQLLKVAKARARTLGATSLLAYTETAESFLTSCGFAEVRPFRVMRHEALETLPSPESTSEFRILSYAEVADPAALEAASRRGYAGQIGHKVPTELSVELTLKTFAADAIFLLFDSADRVIGCCKVGGLEDAPTGRVGYLDAPGVEASYRDHGLYRALALTGLGKLRRDGYARADLMSWGDSEEAVETYKRMGFKLVKVVKGFGLEL